MRKLLAVTKVDAACQTDEAVPTEVIEARDIDSDDKTSTEEDDEEEI